jgi:restriction system-associated AAA family ATPase
MKLISLKINSDSGFRSLKGGFKINFFSDENSENNFYPRVLAGRNGSGKSNVLEALANIFYHLDCIYANNLPEGFLKDKNNIEGFDNSKCIVDAYELVYSIQILPEYVDDLDAKSTKFIVKFTKKINEKPYFEWLNKAEFTNKALDFGKKEIQKFLPDYIVGYSSGANELLSLPFFKTRFLHFDEYVDKLTRGDGYSYPPKPEGRLIFLDKKFSQAILLVNLLFHDKLEETEYALAELESLEEFRLIIWLDKLIELDEDYLNSLEKTQDDLFDDNFGKVKITKNLLKSIEELKSCATCYYEGSLPSRIVEEDTDEAPRNYLVLDFKVDKVTKEAFTNRFSSPLQLFHFFQVLMELDEHFLSKEDKQTIYRSENIFINDDYSSNPFEEDRILRFKYLSIHKLNLNGKTIYTKQLSDGEHQLLHTLGLSLLFKNENCLFLLDEPETHFNPDWKAQFISSIHECFEGSSANQEMLITTHSPYLISDSEASYVHIFEKDNKTQVVTAHPPDFQTLGASVNKITIQIFKTPITVGNYALEFLDDIDKRFANGEDSKGLIKELEENLGDSVEKTLLIHKLEA